MQLIKLIFFCLFVESIYSFPYTLPTDSNWPTSSNFLDLKKSIVGKVSFRGDSDYKPHTWNRIINVPKPAAIVQPANAQDIIQALKFAKKYKLRISVQSTGYHQDNRNINDNSIHIDMSSMNSKSIDLTRKTITVGPGNNFSQIQQYVAYKTNKSMIVICGGDPGVGIYGWTVGGGHGALTRQHGLGVDALLSVDIILANYTIVTASETQNQELFRSIRGSGGGSYGVTISLTIKLFNDTGVMSNFGGLYELSNKTAEMFANWMINAPNEAAGYYLPQNIGSKFVTISAYCFGNTSFCTPYLSKLKNGCIVTPSISVTCEPSYESYNHFFDFFGLNSDSNGLVYIASTALNASNVVAGLQDITTQIGENPYTVCSGNFVLGGASATIDLNQEKTSVAREMRQSLMAISCSSVMVDSTPFEDRQYQVSVIDNLAEYVFKKYSNWVFWNEPLHNFPKDDWRERYWGGMDNYNRLLAVKKEFDPENIFTCYHCIGYQRIENEHPSVCPADGCTCTNTPNGQCAFTPNIQWGNKVFSCDFDDSTQSACNGKFTYNLNGQQAGLFESSNTLSSLKYDVTDVTSISTLARNNNTCIFPFSQNSINNNFCVKISNIYKCMTSQSFADCNLGKFLGVKTLSPSSLFNFNWESNTAISLPQRGRYSLQFHAFYNCYQTKSFLDFFASDCSDVKDRLTIYSKSSTNELYSVLKQFEFTKKDNVNSWQSYGIDINTNSTQIYLNIKFERIVGASKGEAYFAFDGLTLIDQNSRKV